MKKRGAYLFIAPSLILFAIFIVIPLISVVQLSFVKTDYFDTEWMGLKNYIRIFTDRYYAKALMNSLMYAGLIMPAQIFISLFMSLVVFDMPRWVHDVVRFIFYVPVFAAGVIIANCWKWIFHARSGLLNWILVELGFERVIWFANRYTAIVAISIMQTMGIMGFNVLIYLAAMLGIEKTLFDAAKIDGCGWWKIKMRIILPLIRPQILFTILLSMMGAFQIFEYIYLLTGGGPDGGTSSLMYNLFETGFLLSQYGIGSAKSIMLLLIVLSLAMIKRRIERRTV